jgi:hypothetical protein
VPEIGREDPAGLRGQEPLPGRVGAAGRGIDPGVVQDLPSAHRVLGGTAYLRLWRQATLPRERSDGHPHSD